VGDVIGALLGVNVGFGFVGKNVGVSLFMGIFVGLLVGVAVGVNVGALVGFSVGKRDGGMVGCCNITRRGIEEQKVSEGVFVRRVKERKHEQHDTKHGHLQQAGKTQRDHGRGRWRKSGGG